MRQEKLFQALEPTWEQFCPKYLRISRAEADRIIRLWEEFGSAYFEMAQLTRISPETYRAIAPAVQDGALHVDGEAIQLNAENSRRVADAASRLRRAIPGRTASQKKPRELDGADLIEDLRRRSIALVQEFEAIAEGARGRKLAAAHRRDRAAALGAHAQRRGKRRRVRRQSRGGLGSQN